MRTAVTAMILLLLVIAGVWFYKHFLEFNNVLVQSYIKSESSKYVDEKQAEKIITDAVNHILNSYSLTKEVKDYAKATNLEIERVLIDSAIIQAKSLNYL